MEKGVETVFCYESLKEEMTRLLDYITGRGMVIEGIFIGLNNSRKRYENEAEKVMRRDKEAMKAVDGNFVDPRRLSQMSRRSDGRHHLFHFIHSDQDNRGVLWECLACSLWRNGWRSVVLFFPCNA